MDMRALQLFVNLADELHFGRAASKSHLSPSAATRMVQRLEGELGIALLERDNRSVALTPSGQRFLEYARDSLQRWQLLRTGFADSYAQPEGELRLYCSVTASYSVLAAILPEVRLRYPGIEIHVNTGDQALAIHRVMAGQEDLAIAAHPGELSNKLDFCSLARSPLLCIAPVIACPAREQLDARQPVDWSAVPFIIAESGLARSRLEQWFGENDLKPRVYAYVSGHEAIVSLVALGFGVAVVPRLVLENSPLREKIVTLERGPQLQAFDIGLVARRQSLANPLVRAVWELAGQHRYTGAIEPIAASTAATHLTTG